MRSLKPLFTRSLSSLKQAEKYQYKGVSKKPSMLVQNSHIDTSIWNEIQLADSDIFVTTSAKSGTTWTQEIIAQLLYNGEYENRLNVNSVLEVSQWATFRLAPKDTLISGLDAQLTNANVPRRIIKTHEPVESMPFNKKSKYIFVGRDYRDIIWSLYNHMSLMTDFAIEKLNIDTGYTFTPFPKCNFSDGSFTEYDLWNMMLNEGKPEDGTVDGNPYWSQLWVIGSWWNIRHLPNVKLVHYSNLLQDLSVGMREIADFLDIPIDEDIFPQLVENCSLSAMRGKDNPLGPNIEAFFSDSKQFFFKGQNRRWQNVLTEEDTQNYRDLANIYLDQDGIHWLENGKL